MENSRVDRDHWGWLGLQKNERIIRIIANVQMGCSFLCENKYMDSFTLSTLPLTTRVVQFCAKTKTYPFLQGNEFSHDMKSMKTLEESTWGSTGKSTKRETHVCLIRRRNYGRREKWNWGRSRTCGKWLLDFLLLQYSNRWKWFIFGNIYSYGRPEFHHVAINFIINTTDASPFPFLCRCQRVRGG